MSTPLSEIGAAEILGLIAIIVAIVFGNAAGVGGGGIIMPILLLIFSFKMLEASSLSNFMIFLGFIVRYAYNVSSRHPTRNKPLVDYDLVFIMLPGSLFGTKFGIIINDSLPHPVLLIILAIILMYVSITMFMRGWKLSKDDAQHNNQDQQNQPQNHQQQNNQQQDNNQQQQTVPRSITEPAHNDTTLTMTEDNQKKLDEILLKEAKCLPQKQTILIILLFCLYILSLLIEGSKGLTSIFNVKICSPGFWCSIVGFGLLCFFAVFLIGRDCIIQFSVKKTFGYEASPDEAQWTYGKLAIYTTYGFFIGALSSTFGIGGGMLLSPILLRLNLPPEVASATSGLFVLFTTAASTCLFIAGGYWPWDYGLVTGGVSVASAFTSIYLVAGIVKKCKKPYLIIYIMAFIIFASAVTICASGLYQDSEKYGSLGDSAIWQFHSYCSNK